MIDKVLYRSDVTNYTITKHSDQSDCYQQPTTKTSHDMNDFEWSNSFEVNYINSLIRPIRFADISLLVLIYVNEFDQKFRNDVNKYYKEYIQKQPKNSGFIILKDSYWKYTVRTVRDPMHYETIRTHIDITNAITGKPLQVSHSPEDTIRFFALLTYFTLYNH